MNDYSQPEYYHFSQDSIDLVNFSLNHYEGSCEKLISVLDMGAGCGVIGLEWLKKIKNHCNLTLLEMQDFFYEHLMANCSEMKAADNDNINIEVSDFNLFTPSSQYNVIMTNPPYFIEGYHRPSLIKEKRLCRHISESQLVKWFDYAFDWLQSDGDLFFSFRADQVGLLKTNRWRIVKSERHQNYSLNHWRKQ